MLQVADYSGQFQVFTRRMCILFCVTIVFAVLSLSMLILGGLIISRKLKKASKAKRRALNKLKDK